MAQPAQAMPQMGTLAAVLEQVERKRAAEPDD